MECTENHTVAQWCLSQFVFPYSLYFSPAVLSPDFPPCVSKCPCVLFPLSDRQHSFSVPCHHCCLNSLKSVILTLNTSLCLSPLIATWQKHPTSWTQHEVSNSPCSSSAPASLVRPPLPALDSPFLGDHLVFCPFGGAKLFFPLVGSPSAAFAAISPEGCPSLRLSGHWTCSPSSGHPCSSLWSSPWLFRFHQVQECQGRVRKMLALLPAWSSGLEEMSEELPPLLAASPAEVSPQLFPQSPGFVFSYRNHGGSALPLKVCCDSGLESPEWFWLRVS